MEGDDAAEDDVWQVFFVVSLPCCVICLKVKVRVRSSGPTIGLDHHHKHIACIQKMQQYPLDLRVVQVDIRSCLVQVTGRGQAPRESCLSDASSSST